MYQQKNKVMCCPSDTDSNDGPDTVKVRNCTDLIWLCVFLSFLCLMILIATFAFVYGNPLRLINGYDSFGNICGDKNSQNVNNFELSGLDMSQKKFLFYLDFSNLDQSLQICVKKCPDKDLKSLMELKDFYEKTGIFLCRYDVNLTEIQYPEYFFPMPDSVPSINISEITGSSHGPCPVFPVYKSSSVLNRCIPDTIHSANSILISNMYGMLNSWDLLEEILSDIYESWNWVLILLLFSFCTSLIVIATMYILASVISWFIMVGVSIAFIAVTGLLWWTYISIKCELNETAEEKLLDESVKNEETFLWCAIISTVISIIVLSITYAIRKRIPFLTALFEEASKCLIKLPSLFLLPALTFLLLIIFYTFWATVGIYLATASYPSSRTVKTTGLKLNNSPAALTNGTGQDSVNVSVAEIKSFTVVEYVSSSWEKYIWFIYIIGLIWVSEFLLACQQMITAGSIARWYFNRERNELKSPFLISAGHLFTFHLGSAALGSILITVFKVPRLILTYLQTKYKRERYSGCVKCCICCFHCWEKFIRYMNHNAYTIVMVQGISFCPSAVRAWNILASNTLKLATINSVGDFILFLGKCFVTAVTGCAAVLIFKYNSNLHFYAVPTLIVVVLSFFIAHSVISLYEMVIDTLFLCICEDQEINGDNGYWKRSSLCGANKKPPVAVPVTTVLPTEL